ncbi:hypothetical protein [Paraburkholderia ribeironis]|uniref:hypothetical protein n=1 Tax=Paraburkholderia ribeironis TaxID=1247936 RepID=UPI0013562EF0|nr:hypothetical protein [Paraburkholderia ribeironis]
MNLLYRYLSPGCAALLCIVLLASGFFSAGERTADDGERPEGCDMSVPGGMVRLVQLSVQQVTCHCPLDSIPVVHRLCAKFMRGACPLPLGDVDSWKNQTERFV